MVGARDDRLAIVKLNRVRTPPFRPTLSDCVLATTIRIESSQDGEQKPFRCVNGWHLLTLSCQAANSTGIQTLLEAEKEAAKIVQKARTCMC
jgi:hypothetical protein